MTTRPDQHSLSDWLKLHELSPASCRSLLDAMSKRALTSAQHTGHADPDFSTIDLDTAWRTVVDAMRTLFPAQRGFIDLTVENTVRMLVPRRHGSRKAVTVDNGPSAYPTILYSFAGEPADLLVLAHEFAHALQIRASEIRFVSPVMRETCAFVGEHALIAYCSSRDTILHHGLCQVWEADSRRYFGIGRQQLLAALAQSELAYSYSWNYPIARYLALEAQKRPTADGAWALFAGQVTVGALLRSLGLPTG